MTAAEQTFFSLIRPALQTVGWGSGDFQIQPDPVFLDDHGVVFVCTIPEKRPFVIAVPNDANAPDISRWVGHIGYNLGSALALIATRLGATLVAPHVIERPIQSRSPSRSSRLPLFSPGEDEFGAVPLVIQESRATDLSRAVTRLRIHPNDVAEASVRTGAPTGNTKYRTRAPVEEAILDSLTSSRLQILREEELERVSRSAYLSIDDDLLDLFGFLLFVRIIEDRAEYPLLPRHHLRTLSEGPGLILKLSQLSDQLRADFGAAAVPEIRYNWRAESEISHLIRSLYRDDSRGARYDFRLLDEDILAQLYQLYLSYLHVDRVKAAQIRLFGKDDRLTISVRKEFGIYYTPRSVVDTVLAEVRAHIGLLQKPPKILEPACGAGAFLRPALRWLISEWPDATAAELARHVVGIDLDPRAVTLTQQTLSRTLLAHYDRAAEANLICADFLLDDQLGASEKLEENTFDIVVGNPPFLAHSAGRNIDPERLNEYRQKFRAIAAAGQANLSTFFVAHSLRFLRPGGILGMVIPRALLRGREYVQFRNAILSVADLVSIVDYGSSQVFEDPDNNVALIFLRKRAADLPALDPAGVIAIRYREDFAPLIADALRGVGDSAAIHATLVTGRAVAVSAGPWLVLSATGRSTYEKLTHGTVLLKHVVVSQYTTDVMSGGGKSLFLYPLEGSGDSDSYVLVHSEYLNRTFSISRKLLRRALVRDDITRYRLRPNRLVRLLFYPYLESDGSVITIDDLAGVDQGVPGAREFIDALEPELRSVRANRTGAAWYGPGGARVNAPWHSLSNSQALGPEMLVWPRFSRLPEVAAVRTTEFVPVGSMMAFSITPEFAASSNRLLAFFNSTLANWYSLFTTAKFGRGGYADRNEATFSDLRFPSALFESDLSPVTEALALLKQAEAPLSPAQILRSEREVDEWVYNAYGLTESEKRRIRDEASRFIGNAPLESARQRAGMDSSLVLEIARNAT